MVTNRNVLVDEDGRPLPARIPVVESERERFARINSVLGKDYDFGERDPQSTTSLQTTSSSAPQPEPAPSADESWLKPVPDAPGYRMADRGDKTAREIAANSDPLYDAIMRRRGFKKGEAPGFSANTVIGPNTQLLDVGGQEGFGREEAERVRQDRLLGVPGATRPRTEPTIYSIDEDAYRADLIRRKPGVAPKVEPKPETAPTPAQPAGVTPGATTPIEKPQGTARPIGTDADYRGANEVDYTDRVAPWNRLFSGLAKATTGVEQTGTQQALGERKKKVLEMMMSDPESTISRQYQRYFKQMDPTRDFSTVPASILANHDPRQQRDYEGEIRLKNELGMARDKAKIESMARAKAGTSSMMAGAGLKGLNDQQIQQMDSYNLAVDAVERVLENVDKAQGRWKGIWGNVADMVNAAPSDYLEWKNQVESLKADLVNAVKGVPSDRDLQNIANQIPNLYSDPRSAAITLKEALETVKRKRQKWMDTMKRVGRYVPHEEMEGQSVQAPAGGPPPENAGGGLPTMTPADFVRRKGEGLTQKGGQVFDKTGKVIATMTIK